MNRETIKDDIARLEQQLANHVLEVVQDAGPLKAWYLRPPGGGRMMSVLILSHPEGLSLQGDIAHRGYATNYGLSWFVRDMDYDYLAGKFLRREYSPERAAQHLKSLLEIGNDTRAQVSEDGLDDLDELARTSDDIGEGDWWYSVLPHLMGLEGEDQFPPQDYDHQSTCAIAGIQRTFCLLFWARYSGIGEDGELALKPVDPAPEAP